MELLNIEEKYIKDLAEKLNNIKKYGCNKETIEDALSYLIPKNSEKTIGFEINKGLEAIYFEATTEKVKISVKKLINLINLSIKYLYEIFPDINKEEMFNYYVMYSLTHEISHIKQYLIANGYEKEPYKIIKQAYSDILNVGELNVNFIRNYISLFQYHNYYSRLVLERNANIEGCEIIKKLAEYDENTEIADVFKEVRQRNILYGYDDRFNGSIEETYKRLYLKSLYNKLSKDEAIPIRDRILYGLPVNEETREKILAYKY